MPMNGLQCLLVGLLIVPVVGALAAALLGGRREAIRWVALAATLVSLVVAVLLTVNFAGLLPASEGPPGATFEPRIAVLGDLLRFQDATQAAQTVRLGPIQFYIGLDGLNVW